MSVRILRMMCLKTIKRISRIISLGVSKGYIYAKSRKNGWLWRCLLSGSRKYGELVTSGRMHVGFIFSPSLLLKLLQYVDNSPHNAISVGILISYLLLIPEHGDYTETYLRAIDIRSGRWSGSNSV